MIAKLYRTNTNSSQRLVKDALEENGIEYEERLMLTKPITKDELFEMLQHTENGVEDLISKRSKVLDEFAECGMDIEDFSLTELHYAITKHPNLLRSPILVYKDTTMVGYNTNNAAFIGCRDVRRREYNDVLSKIREKEDKDIQKMLRGELSVKVEYARKI